MGTPRHASIRTAWDELEFLAYHDVLTGLPNRMLVEQRLAKAIESAERQRGEVALLYVDLNDFKLVNDSLGHSAGDEVLCEVAARLAQVMRRDDTLARHGGDEFLVVLPGAGAEAAAEVADRLRSVLAAQRFRIGDAEFALDASIGASVYPRDADDADALARHADAAMYQAKVAGGGFAIYEGGGPDPLAQLALAAKMRGALERGDFELHYQPIYRLATGAAVGVEALLRWRDPDRGELVPPLEFIPVAERTGLIDALGAFVLDEVCRQAEEWEDRGLAPHFGVNISPRQLRRADVLRSFADGLRLRGLDPRRFILEVTESAWNLDASRLVPVLAELRSGGLALAIDDFGAGYSSLARLRELPVQVIKIDRAFMRGVPTDTKANAVVRAILQLADAFDCDVVAEGIETAGQLEFLRAHGCRLGQGFHLARPLTADAVGELLVRSLDSGRRLAAA